ncbi:MAG: biopolymer transporter ExbD, partial [Verrucomicrobiae bacterium]|nr:biopolymer transporter ExbD [Verrucomicrobiae bacterium]
EAVIVPALAVIVTFGGAAALVARFRSGQRRRAVWLAAFVATGLFLAAFASGASRWRYVDEAPPPRPEPRFIVRNNLPVGDSAATGNTVTPLPEDFSQPPEAVLRAATGPTNTLWPAWLWLGGIVLVLARTAGQRIVFDLVILRKSDAAGADLRERVHELAAELGMRGRVRVRMVSGLLSPVAHGTWRPTVFVPEEFDSAHSVRERDAMLAHELAHLAARDPFWHGTARLLVAALWWHPLAWWALGRLRSASEAAADEASVLIENGPSELAACLVALGARLQGQRIGWLGMAGNGFRSELGRRVERLLALPAEGHSWRQSRMGWLGTGSLALLGAGALLAVTAWALPEQGDSRPTLLAAAQVALTPALPGTPSSAAGASHPSAESSDSGNPLLESNDSPVGSWPARQTAEQGQQLADLAGRVNIGKGPRYDGPPLTYRFDQSFLDYFGERGVLEVEKAMAVINTAPVHDWNQRSVPVSEPASSVAPVPIVAAYPQDPQVADVQVLQGDRLLLNQAEVSLDDLCAALAEMHKKDPGLVVRLGAGKATQMTALVPVLDRLTAIGITRISLRTQPSGEAQEDPAPGTIAEQPAVAPPAPAMAGFGSASIPKPTEPGSPTNLITRLYRVNPDTVVRSLQEAGVSGIRTNGLSLDVVRGVLELAGLDWGGTNGFADPGESGVDGARPQGANRPAIYLNHSTADLLVRANPEDHERIERALAFLNPQPQQVTIEVKFLEITGDDYENLGFDWYLGNASIDDKTILSPGVAITDGTPTNALTGPRAPAAQAESGGVFPGTAPDPSTLTHQVGSAGNPAMARLNQGRLNWPELTPAGGTNMVLEGPVKALLDGATNVLVERVTGKVTGILSEAQYRTVLKALEARPGVDVLAAPRVTTLSGRQAQIQVVDLQTVVTGLDLDAVKEGKPVRVGTTNAPPFKTAQIPVGPTLDVIPIVDADGETINLTLLPMLTEFIGYDDPGQFQALTANHAAPTPLPRFRIRQVATQVRIKDGQTVVLGGMPARESRRAANKVPTLGDLPVVGEFFRSEGTQEVRKNLLIFVTATLIDPAGNPIHPH